MNNDNSNLSGVAAQNFKADKGLLSMDRLIRLTKDVFSELTNAQRAEWFDKVRSMPSDCHLIGAVDTQGRFLGCFDCGDDLFEDDWNSATVVFWMLHSLPRWEG
jgi:hypothetical protein